MSASRRRLVLFAACLIGASAPAAGCMSWHGHQGQYGTVPVAAPKEMTKVPLAPYVIEPPDILNIDALRLVPKGIYKIEAQDTVLLRVTKTFPDEPLDGPFQVDADGTIDLGATYGGKLKLADLTIEDARVALMKRLSNHIMGHTVAISAIPGRAFQQVRGQHLVRPDGTVGLGVYGSVPVMGLTVEEARTTIELHLSKYFQRPEVSVDVAAFNSKLLYVILDGAGSGQQVVRLPVTGNETVLDAIAQVNGLLPVSDKREISVARPSPNDEAGDQVFVVDWEGLTTRGRTATNYQLRPGDRVYINSDHLVEFDTRLARLLSPIERLFGVTLLGAAAVNEINGGGNTGNGNGNGR